MSQNSLSFDAEIMHRTSNLLRQQKILTSITDIGSSLRLPMNINTLLKRVATATCEALGFRHSALYLVGVDGHFHAQATYGISLEEETYLCQHPLPDTVTALLIDERYRISNSYFIPTESSLWQNTAFAEYFLVVNDEQPIAPSPSMKNIWLPTDLIVVPLVSAENTLLGVLTPDAPLDGLRPGTETMAYLELLANQAAIVIEGANLYEAAKRSSEELAALVEIGHALFSPGALHDLYSVYETVYEQVCRVIPTDSLFIARYYHTDDKLIMDYIVDEGVVYPPENYKKIPLFVRKLFSKEQKAFLFSTQEEYKISNHITEPDADTDLVGGSRPSESLLFVPIYFGEEALGILSVQSYTTYAYTQRHIEMLQKISLQAGIAITNARLYTELREAVQRAQESEQLKNHFLLTASHELRTPLTAIQGYLELLSMHGETVLSEKDKARFIANARRASEEVILLLGNVMDTSRMNQKEIALNVSRVELHRALLPVLDILEPALVRQRRKIEVMIDNALCVYADESRLRQVLLNILNNALKYTPKGTHIVISAVAATTLQTHLSAIHSTQGVQMLSRNTPFVLLSIQDQGNGIAPEDQAQLFTKFMRLPNAVNSMQRGSGLGLYLCRQLIEAMDGAIWVESTGVAGEGATFFIALPHAFP